MPRIKDLTTKTGNLSSADQFVSDNGTSVTKIDYTALARAIIEQYNGSTLAGSAQSVQAALNSLNSKLFHYYSGALNDLRTTGIYYGDFSDSPNSNSTFGVCIVSPCPNPANTMQRLFAQGFAQGIVEYSRTSSNATTWRDWVKMPTRAEMDAITNNPFPIKRTLTSSDNLDNITESGAYGVVTSIPTNVPSEATGNYGLLLVFGGTSGTSTWCFQLYAYTGRALFYRRKFGSASDSWAAWTKVTGTVVS